MPRPIWKGHISFGLVQVPVVLHTAESRSDLSFHLLDSRDNARVRYRRINEVTGEEVPWDDVVKAYEYDEGNYVVLTDEDFQRAAAEATQAVEIESFVDAGEISPLYFDRPYYLAPGKKGDKGYALLREALRRSGKAGIAKVVIRTRQYLSMLMVQDQAMVLMLLRFKEELREPPVDELPTADLKKLGVTPREVKMAEDLVEAMSGEWKPEEYKDEYRDALMKWIETKAESGGVMPSPEGEAEEAEAPSIINITKLLQESLRRGGKGKRPAARSTVRKRKPTPARRRAG